MSINLELPYPPSINHYYKTVRVGHSVRVFIGAEGLLFREQVTGIVVQHKLRSKQELIVPYFEKERLAVSILIYPPDKRKRDIDNIIKPIFDSLQHAFVFKNDSQIDYLCVERMEIIKGGSITVSVGVNG